MLDRELNLALLGETLARNQVDYLVIGGFAVVLQGGDTATQDIDLTFELSDQNLERLANALEELSAKPKRWLVPQYRLQRIDLRSDWLHLESSAGDIDLISKPPGTTYIDLKADSEEVVVDGATIFVASPKQLLAMKTFANRDKDQRHIKELETVVKLREKS